MTGRPPLGDAGRTITATVKLSKLEQAYLKRRYGTMSAGLRVALDEMLPDSINTPGRAVRPRNVVNTQDLLFSDKTCKHPGWKVVGRGSKTKTIVKECRACGARVTETE